jgi:hypothetical protein
VVVEPSASYTTTNGNNTNVTTAGYTTPATSYYVPTYSTPMYYYPSTYSYPSNYYYGGYYPSYYGNYGYYGPGWSGGGFGFRFR